MNDGDLMSLRPPLSVPLAAKDRAYVSQLAFANRRSVVARYPPKFDPLWNMNVLLSLESAARYPRLGQRSFHREYGTDYHLTHRP